MTKVLYITLITFLCLQCTIALGVNDINKLQNNKKIIGLGFCMDDKDAKTHWQKAFEVLPEDQRPNFERAYKGKKLTSSQARILFDYTSEIRLQKIKILYKNEWNHLLPNEKMMIEALMYENNFQLIGKHSNFYQNIKQLVEERKKMLGVNFARHRVKPTDNKFDIDKLEKHEKYLYKALKEIRCYSNPEQDSQIQIKRDALASLGNSYDFKDIVYEPICTKK